MFNIAKNKYYSNNEEESELNELSSNIDLNNYYQISDDFNPNFYREKNESKNIEDKIINNSDLSSLSFIDNVKNETNKLINQNEKNNCSFESEIARALKKIAINYYNNLNNDNNNKHHCSMIFNYYCSPFITQQNNSFQLENKNEKHYNNIENPFSYINNI